MATILKKHPIYIQYIDIHKLESEGHILSILMVQPFLIEFCDIGSFNEHYWTQLIRINEVFIKYKEIYYTELIKK